MKRSAPSGWTCPSCTYDNNEDSYLCDMCTHARPGWWQCSHCGLMNGDSVSKCDACTLESVSRVVPSDDVPEDYMKGWKLCHSSKGGYTHESFKPKASDGEGDVVLNVATLNVWFEPHYFQQRCVAHIDVMREEKLDVMCMQEMTLDELKVWYGHPWVQQHCWISHSPRDINGYSVCIVSCGVLPYHVATTPLKSAMGRTLYHAHFKWEKKGQEKTSLCVATTHLESLSEYTQSRIHQLRQIEDALSSCECVVLCGDFNYDSNKTPTPAEAFVLNANQWKDVAPPKLCTIGHNYPSKKYPPARFDRMLLKSSSNWMCQSSSLFGQKQLPRQGPEPESSYIRKFGPFLSDHYGIIAKLIRRKP